MVKSNFWPGHPGAHVENNNRGIARYRSSALLQCTNWTRHERKQIKNKCWNLKFAEVKAKKNQNVCD